MRIEEDQLDGEGEVTTTHSGSYGYRYTSRTTGELSLEFDAGEACEVRLTFSGEGTGSYSYRCGGASRGQGSFRMSELVNRVPEITSTGPFEVEENMTVVGQLEAVDWDKEDEVTGYGIAGGADGALFAVEAETGELSFREAPDFENPGDVESEEPQSKAGDNEYILVVEVTSGEGERERAREEAIRVRVRDVEMEEAVEEEEEAESLFVPVILSAAGRKQSFFTSELTLTNRGDEEVELDYTYMPRREEEGGTASDVLPAGRQRIATDAMDYLRDLGVPIPRRGNGSARYGWRCRWDPRWRRWCGPPRWCQREGRGWPTWGWRRRRALTSRSICADCVRTARIAQTWPSRTWGSRERVRSR